ncbi:WAT1-related protein At3g28050-like [Abrus precatorius]|uniref:WAT1-related protein n=1 Tax=Abrus precatorius TaxID=3816 RepID=A0A8B8LXX9_ABRPR|nr:WAT1-related protein At3g28050-like [Abrus precatorius]
MQGVGVTTMMVVVQSLEVGLNNIIKVATTKGMSNLVFIVYSNVVALCLLLLSTFIYRRKRPSSPITRSTLCRIFILSLVSCSEQTLMYTGIGYSSPTLASVMVDLTPAFTFIVAIVSRMEKLDLKLGSSKAKSIGTVVSIIGALTVTLYKGMPLTDDDSDSLQNTVTVAPFSSHQSDWLLGGLLLSAASFCLSLVFIIKTWIIKDYPEELTVTTISCGFVVIQSTVVAFAAEGSSKAWALGFDMELIAILYSAIFVVSLRSIVHIWACRKRGPVYVAMFTPLGMVIALVMGIIFLGDTLYLGSIIGATVISSGFYGVIWGQAQEENMVHEKNGTFRFVSSSSSQAPLLQNKSMEV